MHCAGLASKEDRSLIVGLFNRVGPYEQGEVARLWRLIEATGSLEYAREKVSRYTEDAKSALATVPEGRAKSLLSELADYLASRYS